jgi:hypothetical protein
MAHYPQLLQSHQPSWLLHAVPTFSLSLAIYVPGQEQPGRVNALWGMAF